MFMNLVTSDCPGAENPFSVSQDVVQFAYTGAGQRLQLKRFAFVGQLSQLKALARRCMRAIPRQACHLW